MKLIIDNIDYAPSELHDQLPIIANLIKIMPGEDRPDYWLCSVHKPIRWIKNNHEYQIEHLVIAARWAGTKIKKGIKHLPIGISYVIDVSLLNDEKFIFSKSSYVAIGLASDINNSSIKPLKNIIYGNIAPAFGTGKPIKINNNSKSNRLLSYVKHLFIRQ